MSLLSNEPSRRLYMQGRGTGPVVLSGRSVALETITQEGLLARDKREKKMKIYWFIEIQGGYGRRKKRKRHGIREE